MHRQDVLASLGRYLELWSAAARSGGAPFAFAAEEQTLRRIVDFVRATPAAFERTSHVGHLTGSALVVSPDLTQVLLTLHRKLGKWLQLGGHADGHPRLEEVALREAEEESGLTGLGFLAFEAALSRAGGGHGFPQGLAPGGVLPFDCDCHAIPARPAEPEHIHYDVRYLVMAEADRPLVISSESRDLRWFSLADAAAVAPEESMHRQFRKLEWLRGRLAAAVGS